MTLRLPARLLVTALIRQVEQAGGFAAIVARGEETGGTILVQMAEKGQFSGFLERMTDLDGRSVLNRCGPGLDADSLAISDYVERRRARDPDLWIIELDIADAERFAAETICVG